MPDHCPACRVHRELTTHRDDCAPDWTQRRMALNFARIIAERACPDYPATRTEPGTGATDAPSPGPTPTRTPASAQEDA